MEFEATPKRICLTGDNSVAVGEPDRLSALPDCLLHAIMSLMKARQVVQTCVLSTRWRHLWRSVPCLDLDLDEFKMVNDKDRDSEDYVIGAEDDKGWEDFEDFAVNLMFRRNIALLDSFRLHVNKYTAPPSGSGRAATWLRRAMKYCAPDPHIHREGLSSNCWRLKKLELCNVLLDSRFTKHVSSECHSLEVLKLVDCGCDHFAITSHSLKNLVLKNSRGFKLSDITSSTLKRLVIFGGSITDNCTLVIRAPAVAYLFLSMAVQDFVLGISIHEMASLDKASITLRGYGNVMASELLCSISNVTHLKLSNFDMMVLRGESKKIVQFKNLRGLLLDNCDLSYFLIFARFLENSPNLEKLTLRRCKCNTFQVMIANVRLNDITYKDDDIRQLVELLLRIGGKLPKNRLKLTKVD